MKNVKFIIAAAASAALLLSCGGSVTPDSAITTDTIDDAITLNTVSAVSILSAAPTITADGAAAITAPKLMMGDSSEETPTEIPEEEVVTDFTQYITLMDSLLSDEGKPYTVEELVSDRVEYEFHLLITTRDLAGNEMTYEMYFNKVDPIIDDDDSETDESEIEDSEESEVEDSEEPSSIEAAPKARMGDRDDDDDEDRYGHDDDEDMGHHGNFDDDELRGTDGEGEYDRNRDRDIGDDDDEDEVFLKGIVILEEVEYELLGMREDDDEGTETKFFIALDENNWIKIKNEVEANEEKFAIAMKKDGVFSKMMFKSEIEEDGEVKLMLMTLIDGELVSYMFKQIQNDEGEEILLIKVIENGEILHIVAVPSIDAETGETVYDFFVTESGRNYEGRPGHHHHNN